MSELKEIEKLESHYYESSVTEKINELIDAVNGMRKEHPEPEKLKPLWKKFYDSKIVHLGSPEGYWEKVARIALEHFKEMLPEQIGIPTSCCGITAKERFDELRSKLETERRGLE